jgi:hypothetical protein
VPPTLQEIPGELRKLLQGSPFGQVFPPKPNPPPLTIDGRTAGLRLLREYLAALKFYRPGAATGPDGRVVGRPIPFQVAQEHIHIEWPDSIAKLLVAECAAVFIPGPQVEYQPIGLVNFVEESTKDVYRRGTVLQWQACAKEDVQLEFWCPTVAHRRAIKAGVEIAMNPVEQMAGIRFAMPAYFGQLVTFALNGAQVIDDENSARNRRRLRLKIDMRYNVVALVNYVTLRPQVQVSVDVNQDVVPALAIGETTVNSPE